ncbi:MAG: ribosome-associated translation inhibitor RaiA [Candidatus Omnitrophota bacterium]
MRVEVTYKNVEKSEFLENVIDKDLEKIGRRIQMFRENDPIHITVHLEKSQHCEEYLCNSHIYLPKRVLRADSRESNMATAINKAFAALAKQLEKLKCKVEAHLKRRDTRQTR